MNTRMEPAIFDPTRSVKKLREKLKSLLPSAIGRLWRQSPMVRYRSRKVIERYDRYYAECRGAWDATRATQSDLARQIAADLGEQGIACTRMGELSPAPWDRHMAFVDRAFAEVSNHLCLNVRGSHLDWFAPDSLDQVRLHPPQYSYLKPAVVRQQRDLGSAFCSAEITSPIEVLLGCSVRLVSLVAYRCYEGGGADLGSMIWHYDNQPAPSYKIMVYVDDVPEGSGEFEYLLASQKDIVVSPGYGNSRLHDDLKVRNYRTYKCVGVRGDAFYFNNNGYHRGGNVMRGERTVLLASYRPSKIPAPDHLLRFGHGDLGQTWGPNPDGVWWAH